MSERLAEGWYRGAGWLHLLRPLSWLYGLITAIRRLAFAAGWLKVHTFPVPVIVVGNLTVGGTGKTPLTLWLIRFLEEQGYRPGVVSRGYGGKASWPFPVRPDSSASEAGDEPLLIARTSGVPVVVDPVRPRAVERLLRDHACDIVISDDGLQHLALGRDLELVVVDGKRGFGNGRLLPSGPLREPLSRLRTVDAVIVNGSLSEAGRMAASLSGAPPVFGLALSPMALCPVGESQGTPPAPPAIVHAVAGIGHPERFFRTLEEAGFSVIPHAFPDHHAFRAEDLGFAEHYPVIMTTKDAVKCEGLAVPDLWQLPVEACPGPGLAEFMLASLARLEEKKPHD